MNYPVIDFFTKGVKFVSADGVFLSAAVFIVLLFAVFLMLTLKGKLKQNNAACVFFSVAALSTITVMSALFLIAETPLYIFAFYLAVLTAETVVLLLPLKVVSDKKSDKAEEKALIKYIDGEIKKENLKKAKDYGYETIKCQDVNKKSYPEEINFSHVKSVIDRLEYFDLSPADKKQIDNLKSELYFAENDGFTPEKKSRINDGLSGLLKIMSKYGV